jgi:hypothetical protein
MFQKYGMSSWTEFGWFRKRRVAGSFEHGIDPWGSLRDGSFLSDFWLLAILGVSFETGAGIYSGCLSQLSLGLLCCKRPQGIPQYGNVYEPISYTVVGLLKLLSLRHKPA